LPRQALFQARYRGKRYSFGYPACPELELMEPEASVSALVFHHPDAGYFSVGAQELAEATAD
jgi:5-methyltetrahydrofolate--homocysteine methyltransferase